MGGTLDIKDSRLYVGGLSGTLDEVMGHSGEVGETNWYNVVWSLLRTRRHMWPLFHGWHRGTFLSEASGWSSCVDESDPFQALWAVRWWRRIIFSHSCQVSECLTMKWAPPSSSFWDTWEGYGRLFFLWPVILSEMYSGYLKCMSCNLWQHKQNQSSLGWNYKDEGDGRDVWAWIMQLAVFISAYTACISACTLRSHPSSESSCVCFSPISEEGILKTLL